MFVVRIADNPDFYRSPPGSPSRETRLQRLAGPSQTASTREVEHFLDSRGVYGVASCFLQFRITFGEIFPEIGL
jgi:hypothetical protein